MALHRNFKNVFIYFALNVTARLFSYLESLIRSKAEKTINFEGTMKAMEVTKNVLRLLD